MKRLAIILSILFLLTASSSALAAKGVVCEYNYYDQGTRNGVSYLGGGVGEQERLCLASMEKEYNLKMVFALSSKSYLANETVRIQDMQGKEVFQGRVDGPWLMVKLPSGDYQVTVSREAHRTEARHVKVGDGMQVQYFTWKS
jgi:hypothetical protein